MSLPDPVATIQKNRRETVRVSLSEFKGTDLVDLRVFAPKPGGVEGEVVPTPKGLALSIAKLPELRAALALAQAEAERRGLLPVNGSAA